MIRMSKEELKRRIFLKRQHIFLLSAEVAVMEVELERMEKKEGKELKVFLDNKYIMV
jgi:hypothetical protein